MNYCIALIAVAFVALASAAPPPKAKGKGSPEGAAAAKKDPPGNQGHKATPVKQSAPANKAAGSKAAGSKAAPAGNKVAAAAAATAAKKAPTKSNKGKVKCTVCRGYGKDCNSDQTEENDKCVKITGTVGDPSQIPDFVTVIGGAGTKAAAAANKGKEVTLCQGVSQSQIDYVTFGEAYAGEGCTTYDSLFGLENCKVCVCSKQKCDG